MKTLRYFLILAAAATFAFWHFSGSPEPTPSPAKPEPVQAQAPLKEAHDEVVAQAASATRVKVVPKPLGEAGAKPLGNTVEFEVVDGLAIAYGDVILGRVSTGSTAKRGSYEAPAPQLWDHPEIPYVIAPDLPSPARVEAALAYFRAHTPVNFVPYPGSGDAIVFEPGTNHCYSALGRQGGLQVVKLAPGCQSGEIIHEIMHALGFIHEQSRPDRDQYVDVLWQNIDEEFKSQYNIVPDNFATAIRGFGFDYHSAMLYRPDTFAKSPGLATMQSKTPETIVPVTQGLSDGDIQRIKRLYFRE